MAFPQTSLTLIQRLSTGGSEADWKDFLEDYWGPVCRFAMRRGNLAVHDAEDVASETMQAIIKNDLLMRWRDSRAAKLRTLICSVARNIMSNRGRVASGRKQIMEELAKLPNEDLPPSLSSSDSSQEHADAFYAAWVDELLTQSIDRLMLELHREGKGDYFRVLHGRVCDGLTTREVAEMLSLKPTAVENYLKAAKKRLAATLESATRRHAEKYAGPASVKEEFEEEWRQLSNYLSEHGGLADGIRRCHEELATRRRGGRKPAESIHHNERLDVAGEQIG